MSCRHASRSWHLTLWGFVLYSSILEARYEGKLPFGLVVSVKFAIRRGSGQSLAFLISTVRGLVRPFQTLR